MAEKEYIEREVLLEFLQTTYNIPLDQWMARNYWSKVVEIKQKFISCIEKLPAADVAPVVHGEWKISESGAIYFCNGCGYFAMPRESREWRYCPHCGARMDGGKHG